MIRGQNLPAITQIADSDVLIVDSASGGTRKITYAQLCQAVKQTLGIREVIDSVNITEDGYLMGGKVIADELAKLNDDLANNNHIMAASVTDLNDVNVTAVNQVFVFRVVPGQTANMPTNTHGFVLHMYVDSNQYAIQVYFGLLNANSLYMRTKFASGWQDWVNFLSN